MATLTRAIATALFHLAVPLFASAQNAPLSNPVLARLNSGMVRVEGVDIVPITDVPFSAKVLVELTRTLPDGTVVTHRTFNTIARDSHGRTRNEVRSWSAAEGSEPHLSYWILDDPESHARVYVYPDTHSATRFVLDPNTTNPPAATISPAARTLEVERLGTKSQDGLTLEGTRETQVDPPSTSSTGATLNLTKETWYSPDLRLNISVTRRDTRSGVQTVRVTEINRTEPPASLLEIPAEYRLKTESDMQKEPPIGGYVPLQRIRMGGKVMAAQLDRRVNPEYPEQARKGHITGTVQLHVIVAKDGSVEQIEVLSGHPLLVQAAIDAVKQWHYRPTQLNGEPVQVDTTIDVNFSH